MRCTWISLLPLVAGLAVGARADVHFAVDGAVDVHPISRFVYGWNGSLDGAYAHLAFTRLGGNRWTAYDWENNASNAGTDWFNQNDDLLSSSDIPGEAVRPAVAAAQAQGAGILVTVPINGYVAADKNGGGDVSQTPNYLAVRFRHSLAAKGAPFSLAPDPGDAFVYQDEFVHWLVHAFPASEDSVFYSLDNEPDLWPSTHPRIHPGATTYAELAEKTIAYAEAIKAVVPGALVFGPVSYGWYGYTALQGAPDAAGRDFLDFWLDAIEARRQTTGTRVVDVLDLHWYPEARGDGTRITGMETTPGVVAARLQAPRSLWDPSYTETSWIAQDSVGGPIALIPRLRAKIAAHAPGTALAFTEYDYGAGGNISGGLAQADVLGIFGREDVFAAAEWPLAGDESFIAAAFRMYRDFDGAGGEFGDVSIRATSDDVAAASIYASRDSSDPTRVVLVAINKTAAALPATIELANLGPLGSAHAFQLSAAAAAPVDAGAVAPSSATRIDVALPAYSATTLVATVPEPGTLVAALAAAGALAATRGRTRRA